MRLREHSEKPRQFHRYGTGPYHLGMELEVEAPNHAAMAEGLALEGPKCRIALAKHDGSLGNYGWELVTHPFGRDAWLRPEDCSQLLRIRELIASLKKMGYSSHDNGRCGLHLHVSATAFRGGIGPRYVADSRQYYGWSTKVRRSTHAYWFWRTINSNLFKKISQREKFYYCETNTSRALAECTRSRTRYVACNFTEKTVEVRIFRGNLRWDRIQKAVQAVIAAVEFSRELTSKNWHQDISMLFAKYVALHRETYPQLYAYLCEVKLLRNDKLAQLQESGVQ